MKWFKNIFRRKEKETPQSLRIEGIAEAPLTAEPDDAELAAQALLEMMAEASDKSRNNDKAARRNRSAEGRLQGKNVITESRNNERENGGQEKTAAYFKALAERMRQAHVAATQRTVRFVAFCEQELKNVHLPARGPGSLALLEAELMKRIDTIERVGGDLKRRWQHCVAEVTVRLMKATAHTDSTEKEETTDDKDVTDKEKSTD